MSDSSDTTLGEILVQMGLCTKDQIYEILISDHCQNRCGLFGELLISAGAITKSQLDKAMEVQAGLRSEDRCRTALATADIALVRKQDTNAKQRKLTERGEQMAKRVTATNNPAITSQVLALKSK